jgi:hypothetical protein
MQLLGLPRAPVAAYNGDVWKVPAHSGAGATAGLVKTQAGGGIVKVWITNDALKTGVQEVQGEVSKVSGGHMFISEASRCYWKPDWHTDRESAVRRAEEMREGKIAVLRRDLERLTALKF